VVQGILVGLIAVLVVVIVTPRLSAYITPQSYVYGDATTAVLIEWSERDGHMDGALQLAAVDEQAQVIRAQYTGFSGLHDGSQISITFADPLAGAQTVDGTLGWRSLRLELPQSGGQIAVVPLLPGDVAGYSRAVQAVQRAHPDLEIQGN
jgi:hypothetical protein